MARSKRIDYPGAWHHVMGRGKRKEPIFADDVDCRSFLGTVGEMVDRHGLEVHAYSLMPNHYHLLLHSPLGTLSRGMKHLNGRFTQRMNARHEWDGPVFRGRFRSQIVESEEYQRYLLAYLHLNPVRANLVTRPDQECWTSHRALVGLEKAPSWLSDGLVQRLLGSGEALDRFVRDVHQGSEPWPQDMRLDAGWIKRGQEPSEEADETAVPRRDPEELLSLVLEVTGASLEDLRTPKRGRGGNRARRFAMVTLAARPELTHRDVAELLDSTLQQVWNVLYRSRRHPEPEVFETWRERWVEMEEKMKGEGV